MSNGAKLSETKIIKCINFRADSVVGETWFSGPCLAPHRVCDAPGNSVTCGQTPRPHVRHITGLETAGSAAAEIPFLLPFLDARFWRAHLLTLTYIYFQLRSRSTRLRASVSPIISTLNWASSSCNNDSETTLLRLVMRFRLSCPPSQLDSMATAPSRSRRRTRHSRRNALAALALATAALVPTTSAVFVTVPAGTAGQVIPTGGWTSGTFSASGKVSPCLVLLSVLSNPPASCDRSGRSGHQYYCILCCIVQAEQLLAAASRGSAGMLLASPGSAVGVTQQLDAIVSIVIALYNHISPMEFHSPTSWCS